MKSLTIFLISLFISSSAFANLPNFVSIEKSCELLEERMALMAELIKEHEGSDIVYTFAQYYAEDSQVYDRDCK